MKDQKVKALVFQIQEISNLGHTHAIVHVSMHTCKHAYPSLSFGEYNSNSYSNFTTPI